MINVSRKAFSTPCEHVAVNLKLSWLTYHAYANSAHFQHCVFSVRIICSHHNGGAHDFTAALFFCFALKSMQIDNF